MSPDNFIAAKAVEAVRNLYNTDIEPAALQVQVTRKEFEGDYTLVVFPLLKVSKKSPEATGAEIGDWLKANVQEISDYNVIKGFLNISFSNSWWNGVFDTIVKAGDSFGRFPSTGKTIMVEFSSPNTNKPLHLS